jgi:hypothetical protein
LTEDMNLAELDRPRDRSICRQFQF